MQIRTLFSIALLSIFSLAGVFLFFMLKFQAFKALDHAERDTLEKRNLHIIHTIENQMARNVSYTKDWANWDESWDFMETRDDDYINENFSQDMIEDIGAAGMLYLKPDFSPWYSYPLADKEEEFGRLILFIIGKKQVITDALQNGRHIVLLYDDVLQCHILITVFPVTHTHNIEVSNGYLLTVELVDEKYVTEFAKDVGYPVKLKIHYDTKTLQCVADKTLDGYCHQVYFVDDDKALLKISYVDSERRTMLDFSVEAERLLHQTVQLVFRDTLVVIAAIGLVVILCNLLLAAFFIVRPARYLASRFLSFARTKKLRQRIEVSGPWEIRQMTEAANVMLDEIEKLNQLLEEQSRTDELTKLYNRRYFGEICEQEFRRAIREQTPIGLILLDIDCFKQYNDNYGHLAGDDCLRRLAGILEDNVQRSGDIVARYGGEEFIILLGHGSLSGLKKVTAKIKEALDAAAISHDFSKAADHVTCSFGGVSGVPQNLDEVRTFLLRADALLYQAKEQGRNRAVLSDQLALQSASES